MANLAANSSVAEEIQPSAKGRKREGKAARPIKSPFAHTRHITNIFMVRICVGPGDESSGEIRQRAATIGSYTASSRTSTASPDSSLSGGSKAHVTGDTSKVSAVPAIPSSYEAYAAGLRSAPQEEPMSASDSELKRILRHLTGLLVFPATSAEVTLHPLFGPTAKPNRLR